MHGSGTVTNPFTVLLGARVNAGFFLSGQYCPDLERFLPYPEHEPEVRRHLYLTEFLGIPPQGEELEFPLFENDLKALDKIDATRELKLREYVCIHPGARSLLRRWSPERFAAVAD